MRLPALLTLVLPIALTGCSVMNTTASPGSITGAAITGKVHGGQQPIVGAHIYLMAANTTGYGGPNIAPSALNASISLLTTLTGHSDSLGNYVTSAADGSFTITGDYTCLAGQQVYLYALGGNPGSGTNPNSALMATLGSCPGTSFSSTLNTWVNEVTTIATAYAFAGFASDATHVSSSGSTLAQTGIANAFANANNLVDPTTGNARATTPAGNGTVPQQELNTLANILAACINTTGTGTGTNPCNTLFSNTLFSGTSGTTPNDTATAAINIAHNPAANVTALYAIPPPTIAFGNALQYQPYDFTVFLKYASSSLGIAYGIAIDSLGQVWVSNEDSGVVELSPLGAILSGASGYLDGNQRGTLGIAIDLTGDAWVANGYSNTVTRVSTTGVVTSYPGHGGYGGNSAAGPGYIAVDANNNIWVGEESGVPVFKLSNAGVLESGSGYVLSSGENVFSGGLEYPYAIAIDGAGSVLAPDSKSVVAKLSSTGAVLPGTAGYALNATAIPRALAIDNAGNAWVASETTLVSNPGGVIKLSNSGSTLAANTGANLQDPVGLAIDGAGSVWVTGGGSGSEHLMELSTSGALISPANGYGSTLLNFPQQVAIDGSGNVWIADAYPWVWQVVGAATPVITPIAAGLPTTPTTDGSSNLGTRP